MDSDPLVPTEISPTKKYIMLGCVGLLAAYLIVVMILLIVKAKEFGHIGLYLSAASLLLLTVTIVLVNLYLPQDYMDNKAKYSVLVLNLCLFLVATGFLIHAFEKTPCKCPPLNTCTLSTSPEGGWFQRPDCFPAERNATFITLSANRTCPKDPQWIEIDLTDGEAIDFADFPELDVKA